VNRPSSKALDFRLHPLPSAALGITKLDKEKNQCIRGKNGSTEHSKGNKTVPGKVATTIPKQALQYKPKGRRNRGRPRKRWKDQFHFEDQGTGNTPNPS